MVRMQRYEKNNNQQSIFAFLHKYLQKKLIYLFTDRVDISGSFVSREMEMRIQLQHRLQIVVPISLRAASFIVQRRINATSGFGAA